MGKKNKDTSFPPCAEGLLNNIHKAHVDEVDQPGYNVSGFILGYEDIETRMPPVAIFGYEKHTNPETGEILPNCCSFHKGVYDQAEAWFELFPNCCKVHKEELAPYEYFNKDGYSTISEKIVLWLSQTEYVIKKNIDNKDWFNAITGYIDHCFLWFGGFYIGLNIYLYNLKKFITLPSSTIPSDKAKRLTSYIDYVEKYYKYALCYGFIPKMLQDWHKAFPDGVNYISNMKVAFDPIFNPLPYDINKKKFVYSALPYEFYTKESMDWIIRQSKNLLKKVNALELYKQELLTEPEKAKIELLVRKREFDLESKYDEGNYLSKQPEFMGVFKEWFEDEQNFVNEITPLLSTLPEKTPKVKSSSIKEVSQTGTIKLISFKDKDILESVFELLKGYFPGNDSNLKTALEGEKLEEPIVFPYSQNKLVEVFRRLKYNGYIPNKTSEIRDWLCNNFHFRYKRGQTDEIRQLNPDSVWDILSKGRGEPTKRERICFENIDWLPYKSPLQLSRESESEQL